MYICIYISYLSNFAKLWNLYFFIYLTISLSIYLSIYIYISIYPSIYQEVPAQAGDPPLDPDQPELWEGGAQSAGDPS